VSSRPTLAPRASRPEEPAAAGEARNGSRVDAPLDASRIDHVIGYLLTIASLKTRAVYLQAIGEPEQLRPVEFTMLMLLLGNPGASPKQLSRALRLPPPALTALVDRMVGRRLVERRRSASDGRAFEVRLTPDGQALAERAHGTSGSMEDELLARFTLGERVLLRELLLRLAGPDPALPTGS
jgi:DNA-binding MarR family transcriptional regulator